MTQKINYPRLFISLADGQGEIQSQGDETISTLYKLYTDPTINTATWQFRSAVFLQALRLFGNFPDWLAMQRQNSKLVGFNHDFIRDTLDYIRTGVRKAAPINWLELVNESSDRLVPAQHVDTSDLRLKPGENTIPLLVAWNRHPNGFEDFITTLYVLFGPARVVLS